MAMNILCTSSQLSLDALNLVQALAQGKQDQQGASLSSASIDVALKETASASSVSAKHPPAALIKGTRFSLPKNEFNALGEKKLSIHTPSNPGNVATLNMLGMQPDFNEMENESLFTVDQTVASTKSKAGTNMKGSKAMSANDTKLVWDRDSSVLPKHLAAPDEALNSVTTASSVGTQSLIANESIPDALPSAEVSNVTVLLELGSITTLDPVESLGKSIGLLTSSNSKNLDFSVSNLVSPGLEPSGELNGKDNDPPGVSPNPVTIQAESGQQAETATEMPNAGKKKQMSDKKTVEVNWESIDRIRLFDDQYSTQNPTEQGTEDNHNLPTMQAQHVVLATSSNQGERPDTRLTHFTHSTAPLAGGANMLSSQVHPSTVLRHSTFSSKASLKNTALKLTKFESWPNEVALTYTLCMASISIFGRTSLIQKTALEGSGSLKQSDDAESRGKNYGLLDLAEFKKTAGNGKYDGIM